MMQKRCQTKTIQPEVNMTSPDCDFLKKMGTQVRREILLQKQDV
jgi:hypothetical protein